MTTAVEQVVRYCKRYEVLCAGANERGDCNTTACWNRHRLEQSIDAVPTIAQMPSAEPEIIRCKECRWWDKCGDDIGYCMAAKHGYWSEHWEISIRRTYKGDFYCADADMRGEEE